MEKEEQVKVFALLPRRPDVSQEYFHEHWLHPHGTWTLGMKTLCRYVQNHRVEPGLPGTKESPYEGVVSVWFDDLDAAMSMGEDPVYKATLEPDQPLFIDMAGLGFVFTEEYVVRVGSPVGKDAPGGAKAIALLRRGQGLSPEKFAEGFLKKADDLDDLFPDATRISFGLNLPANYQGDAEPPCDALVEVWFEDADACRREWDRSGAAMLDALAALVDGGATLGDLHEEARLIWPASERAGAA